jgi:hypothetical protein
MEKLHSGDFIICTHPQISLDRPNQGECGGQGSGQEPVVSSSEHGDEHLGSSATQLVN